ncbi:MAG: CocE/NonD family hydrolase [Actinobacteria bacterium]|nr:CocE/NonD family hydrolase [Actinomycetota bacterium]
MPIELPPVEGVRCIKNILVPVSDGVRLAMDLHVPDAPDWAHTPRPVILEYLPYRKDDLAPYSSYHPYLARHGYISARIDCRGTGASEGATTDEYTTREQLDGVDAIGWIAQQPWCTGKVGMYGVSYGGFVQVQIAAHRPPNLATIIPIYFTDDRYADDCHYRGGALRCYYDIGAYGASMIGMNAMPPYPELSGRSWAAIWEEHLARNEPYLLTWLAHPTDGEYWAPGSLRDRYDRVACPVFMIGGWRDGYPNPPLRTFQHLTVPKKLLMGPWNHARPNVAIPGPRIDYLREIVRWCDHWLKGEANGVMDEPPVQVYMQTYDEPRADRLDTTGYWRAETSYPPTGAGWRRYWLAAGGRLSPVSAAQGGSYDEYAYRPTVGVAGGLWSGGVPFGLPTDQRPDEVHALTYTSEPLEEPLEILGRPMVALHVQSTATVMAFVARLCDVAPDGTSALVCNGVLNATRRDSLRDPAPLAPDQVYPLDWELDGTAWRFPAGHRLRLSVCSADFPNLWPTPEPGTNRVYRTTLHPSTLSLPVVPLRGAHEGALPPHELGFAPSDMPAAAYQLGPDEPPWEIATDVLADRTALRTLTRQASRPSPTREVTLTSQLTVAASNRDPADVIASSRHARRIAGPFGDTTVDTACTVRSTRDAFHVTLELDIKVNGLPHHQRRWVRSFPRVLL